MVRYLGFEGLPLDDTFNGLNLIDTPLTYLPAYCVVVVGLSKLCGGAAQSLPRRHLLIWLYLSIFLQFSTSKHLKSCCGPKTSVRLNLFNIYCDVLIIVCNPCPLRYIFYDLEGLLL